MTTIIRSDLFDKGLEVKESYETVKKRLLSEASFIEVTGPGSKILLGKGVIKSASPGLKEKKLKQIKKAGEETKSPGQTKLTGSN